jgi:hypothetical protein
VFKICSAEELLRIAESMHNHCLGSSLTALTQWMILGQSTAGRILLAYMFSASLAGSYLRKHRLVEAQELGLVLLLSIFIIFAIVFTNLGGAEVLTQCLP